MSSSASIFAVYPTLKSASSFFTSQSHTRIPRSRGTSFFFSAFAYSRAFSVSIVAAYVEGRPTPFSSSALMSDASE